MKRNRNPKKANLSALKVVDYKGAYNGKRLKSDETAGGRAYSKAVNTKF